MTRNAVIASYHRRRRRQIGRRIFSYLTPEERISDSYCRQNTRNFFFAFIFSISAARDYENTYFFSKIFA